MITISEERMIPISVLPSALPERSHGRRLHVSSCYRWITHGVCGVVLESIRIGGATYTSHEAIQRFAERMSQTNSFPVNIPKRSGYRVVAAERAKRLVERELGL